MTSPELVAAAALFLLALIHSVVGEQRVIRPLLRQEWKLGLPRAASERLVRFAWHLPTVAWIAMGLAVLGVDPLVGVLLVAGSAWLCLFVWLRGHLAWPLFLLASCAALLGLGLIPPTALVAVGLGTAAALGFLAGLHWYWAAGGRWLYEVAIPTHRDGSPPFSPGPALTVVVGLGLAGFAAVVAAASLQLGPSSLRWVAGAGAAMFLARAAGDRRFVGFSKTIRGTGFSVADDVWFTPACVLLAFGSFAAVIA